MPRPLLSLRGRQRAAGVGLAAALLGAACADRPDPATPAADAVVAAPTAITDAWLAGIDSLGTRLAELDSAVGRLAPRPSGPALAQAQQRFRDARHAFKRVEYLSAYYEPSTVESMNGPALPRVEDDEGPEAVFPPEGFQVLEEQLWSGEAVLDTAAMRSEVGHLRELLPRLRRAASRQVVTEDRAFDAAKLELARVATLGLAGFDSPVAGDGLSEGAAALEGLRPLSRAYAPRLGRYADSLSSALEGAIRALSSSSMDRFDHLGFLATDFRRLALTLQQARTRLGVTVPVERRGFRPDAASPFEAGAFDALAFAAPGIPRPTADQVALGRALFFDNRLSADATRSCATCHLPTRAFTDGLPRSATRSGTGVLRNAPTIINAGLQFGAFADLRTTFLEDQVTDVIGNPEEMHGSITQVAQRLSADSATAARFRAAFPTWGDSAVSAAAMRRAIAAYVRSVIALDSPVDRALRGDLAALSAPERQGFNLFYGKAKCATCHFAPLFGGTVPPMYAEAEVEVLGTPASATGRARLDPDVGRFAVTRAAPHRHAFRTPAVRNVALTAPYMHNGVYQTLEQVVEFYDKGGGTGLGLDVPNQTLPGDRLRLTPDEKSALVAFMRALTDTVGTQPPTRGP